MGLIQRIKDLFWKGAAATGVTGSLSKITDDPRISIDPDEYVRIQTDLEYYSDKLQYIHYQASDGIEKKRPKNTINMAKTAARRIASVIFNEKAEIHVKDNNEADKFLNDVLEDNDFKNKFEEALEKGVALGGFAMRPYIDGNHIKIAWVRADQFYPLQSNTNDISEAAIASRTQRTESNQTKCYTLLEFHQWQADGSYQITNELYKSDSPDVVAIKYHYQHCRYTKSWHHKSPLVVYNGHCSLTLKRREPTTSTSKAHWDLVSWIMLSTSWTILMILTISLFGK